MNINAITSFKSNYRKPFCGINRDTIKSIPNKADGSGYYTSILTPVETQKIDNLAKKFGNLLITFFPTAAGDVINVKPQSKDNADWIDVTNYDVF